MYALAYNYNKTPQTKWIQNNINNNNNRHQNNINNNNANKSTNDIKASKIKPAPITKEQQRTHKID